MLDIISEVIQYSNIDTQVRLCIMNKDTVDKLRISKLNINCNKKFYKLNDIILSQQKYKNPEIIFNWDQKKSVNLCHVLHFTNSKNLVRVEKYIQEALPKKNEYIHKNILYCDEWINIDRLEKIDDMKKHDGVYTYPLYFYRVKYKILNNKIYMCIAYEYGYKCYAQPKNESGTEEIIVSPYHWYAIPSIEIKK